MDATSPHTAPRAPLDAEYVAVALGDAAAHSSALAAQLQASLDRIAANYPRNRLGGEIEILAQLSAHLREHAQALAHGADRALGVLESTGDAEWGGPVPPAILATFERATVLMHPLSPAQIAQACDAGHLVIVRDAAAQGARLSPQWGAIFNREEVDPLQVRLWWPRVMGRACPVALVQTEEPLVWNEVSYVQPLILDPNPTP